jgi:hypothetical protein
MYHKALDQLFLICKIEGLRIGEGSSAREKAIEQWINDWVVKVNFKQPVMKTNLTSEEEDYIKYYMAYKTGDRLIDNNCIAVKSSKYNIETEAFALKRDK